MKKVHYMIAGVVVLALVGAMGGFMLYAVIEWLGGGAVIVLLAVIVIGVTGASIGAEVWRRENQGNVR